jgi:hypothetical protein
VDQVAAAATQVMAGQAHLAKALRAAMVMALTKA